MHCDEQKHFQDRLELEDWSNVRNCLSDEGTSFPDIPIFTKDPRKWL